MPTRFVNPPPEIVKNFSEQIKYGNMADELIEVSAARLAELELLEKNMPELIKAAILDYKKENLRRLHEKDKNDPESVKLRVQRYISKNKDKINERRREKRKELTRRIGEQSELQENQGQGQDASANANADIPNQKTGLTVRFND